MIKQKNINTRSFKLKSFLLTFLAIILLNVISSEWFFRLDLTSEKRYTISKETRHILRNLDDIVFVKIYLDGELNIPLKHFQKSITETLEELQAYAGNNLDFEVTDPFEEADNDETRQKILTELHNKGLNPVNIHHRGKDGSITEKIVIPGGIIAYKGVEIPINLLLNNLGKSGDENLNNSIESLEYTLISNIKNLAEEQVAKIAFIEGHGEWPDPYVGDIMRELSKSYQIDRGKLNSEAGILDNYKAVIVAGAVREFSEKDKYIIDQYIMQGGKVLWLLDGVNVDFDSLAMGYSPAIPNNLNLDDQLFRYGVRINYNIALDAQCTFIPINVALAGNPSNFQPAPWLYYPLINPPADNAITQNLNMVMCRFASTIDTIEARKNIKKTPLLITSNQVMIRKPPAVISLEEISKPPSPESFTLPPQVIGVLLEGKFESVFKNRSVQESFESVPSNKRDESPETKMVVIADADIIRNDVKQTAKGPSISPLGFDRYSNQTYGNKEFLVNVINYLTDDNNLLALRGRELKIRLLNRTKVSEERTKWQVINLLAPILLVFLVGLAFNLIRKARYS